MYADFNVDRKGLIKMKKILFFTSRDMTSPEQGINKKIFLQIETLRRYGFQTDAVYRKNVQQLVLQTDEEEKIIDFNLKRPYKIAASKSLDKYLEKKNYDGVYIRYVFNDRAFDKLLRNLKKKNVPILVEIPTYPYDSEFLDSLENRIVLGMDKMYRSKMKRYVSRIVTYSKDKEIYGIPTIQTMNGIDFRKTERIRCSQDYNGEINMIAVADLAKWHGYDRILEGIGKYYSEQGKRNICFHLVGAGPELHRYKQIIEKWGIEDHVIFYGRKYDKELDSIYDKCNIALECFGGHRKGLKLSSSLKSREYVAKGLPIIASVDIDLFTEYESPYYMKFESNEQPIDIERVIKFCDGIYKGKNINEVTKDIRRFAEGKCDISLVMKPIKEFFEN